MAISYNTIRHSFRVKNNLSMNEYVVADTIRFYSVSRKYSDDGWCGVKRTDIADDLGFTERGVIKIIDGLVSKGFLEKGKNNKVRQTEKWDEAYENSHEQSSSQNNYDMNKVHLPHEQSSSENEPTPYSIRIKGSITILFSKVEVFEQFFKLYSKPNDKAKAKKKFLKIDPENYQKIFDSVEKYVKLSPDKKYRKNAITWLNGECWEDEYEEVQNQKEQDTSLMDEFYKFQDDLFKHNNQI